MNDFYVTLPSNTSPENRTGNFSVHLPNNLDLQGKWEVALSEIQYPHSWNNMHGTVNQSGRADNYIDVTFTNKLTVSVFVPGGYYGTIHELLAAIEYGKQQTSQRLQKAVKRLQSVKREKTVKIFRKQLLAKHVNDIVRGFQLEFDETLQRVRCKLYPGQVRMITFSERLQYMLGFANKKIVLSKRLAQFQPDLRGGFYSLYIYCSLVEPQIVGNTIAPLLRNVHIEGYHGDIIEKLYHTPHYVPVIAKEVDRIEIDIKDDKNQSVPFQFGKTVVKLHFRKKRSLL